MKLVDAHLYEYCLPLRAPLSLGMRALRKRRGLLLRVEGPDGADGWGEAAPLPGFSAETMAEVRAQGQRLVDELPGTDLATSTLEDLLRSLPIDDLPASLRFCAESAVVHLWAVSRGESVVQALGGRRSRVVLNALLTESASDLEGQAERLQQAGYRAVKLKVGRGAVEADVVRVKTLHSVLGEEVALRLDANRAWTFEEAISFAERLGDVPLAYLEEPLQSPSRLAELITTTGLPVALDETTREMSPEGLSDDLPVRAVVLKPTLLGGLSVTRQWAQQARKREILPVVSSSYESGVGLRMLAALAASLSRAPAGLSTYDRLGADVFSPRLPLGEAVVDLPRLFDSPVDRSVLTSVGATPCDNYE